MLISILLGCVVGSVLGLYWHHE